jgi:3',5'-cyclic AMP phosphodiesterase CpdA
MSIATFLHISDLHFGDAGPWTQRLSQLSFVGRWAKGLYGHDFKPLEALPDLRDETTASTDLDLPRLMFTGDLTRVGAPIEFRLGDQYLSDTADVGGAFPLGMNESNWNRIAVSGNHDYWPGASIFPVYPPSNPVASQKRDATFRTCPFVEQVRIPDSPYMIRFIGIDTDADTNWIMRKLGRGHFLSQLEHLDQDPNRLPPYQSDGENREIRVLLLHHSQETDRSRFSLPQILNIHRSSAHELRAFIVRHRISVVLSGHIHAPKIKRRRHDDWEHLDARCGTTAQKPVGAKNDLSKSKFDYKRDLSLKHTALVHQLLEEGDRLVWKTTTHVFTPDVFQAAASRPVTNRPPTTGAFLDHTTLEGGSREAWSDQITVWPR